MSEKMLKSNGWTSWGRPVETTGETRIDRLKQNVVINALALCIGVPVFQIGYTIYSIADSIIELERTNLFYKKFTYYRYNKKEEKYQIKTITVFYEHSNFSGRIGSYTDIRTENYD